MKTSDNIIIGAGLAGLSCGSVLKDCLILEKDSSIGGLAKTVDFKGYKFDLGGHRFFTNDDSIDRFFKNLLEGKTIEVKRKSKIYKDGKFIDYPLRLSSLFQLNPLAISTAFFSYIYRKIKPFNEVSFRDRAINRFGDYLYNLFFRDYSYKAWGRACDKLSYDLVDTRIGRISLSKAIQQVFLKDENIKSFADTFLYPKEGIGEISKCLSKSLDIRKGSEITGLCVSGNRIDKVIVNNSLELPLKKLVSTMPVTQLVDFLNPPKEVKIARDSLKYRGLICIFFILKRKSFTGDHWIYFPGREVFCRLHEPKNWSVSMAPEDKTGICVEVFCDKDDILWKKSDKDLVYETMQDLVEIKKFEIEDYCVIRLDHAYPIYDINYPKNTKAVKDYLAGYKNLFLLGRTGTFRYINMDEVIKDGLSLGKRLADSRSKERCDVLSKVQN